MWPDPITLGGRREQEQSLQSLFCGALISTGFFRQLSRRLLNVQWLCAYPLAAILSRDAESCFNPDRQWVIGQLRVADRVRQMSIDGVSQQCSDGLRGVGRICRPVEVFGHNVERRNFRREKRG